MNSGSAFLVGFHVYLCSLFQNTPGWVGWLVWVPEHRSYSRAPNPGLRGPILTSEASILATEPLILAPEPQILTPEPPILAPEPPILDPEALILAQEPPILALEALITFLVLFGNHRQKYKVGSVNSSPWWIITQMIFDGHTIIRWRLESSLKDLSIEPNSIIPS